MKFAKTLRIAKGGVLVACIALAGQVAAQPEQTAEGAQKFLAMTLPQNGYQSGTFVASFEELKGRLVFRRIKFSGTARVVDVRSPDLCVTEILHDTSFIDLQSSERVYDTSDQGRWLPWEKSSPAHQYYPQNFVNGTIAKDTISWSDVTQVKATSSGATVLIHQRGVDSASSVYLGATDLVARVLYAMEFLRMNCDKAAGTGF